MNPSAENESDRSPGSAGPRDAGERELLRRIAQQDAAAMKELYHAYHRRLARFLMRLTHRYEVTD